MTQMEMVGKMSLREMTCVGSDREEETALVARARAGEQEAVDQLYRSHRREIFGLCLNLSGNREEAQDLLQETFVRAFRGLPSFGGRCQFKTWLTRIAVNLARDLARRRHRRPESPLLATLAAPDSDGGLIDLVRATLGCLEAHQRELLCLRYTQSLSYQEIGDCLGWSQGRVKKGLYRARQAFKQMYLEARNF